jgi:aspartate aminotransferase
MSPIQLSQRARQTPPSPIRRLAHLATAAKAQGTRVYHLNIGQPDIKSPAEFIEGVRLYRDEVVAYESSEGNKRLREEWAGYVDRTLGLNLAPENFLITTGASEALVFVFMTCCDPGDEILIFDPTYANYIGFAAISGVKLVSILTKLEDNFALPSCEEIVAKISPRTRGILLCSPNNPTGTVYSRAELELLLEICNERNIFLIVDETYREIVYDGLSPLSIFHLDPRSERVIVVDSLSKRFSLCGARIGCLITSNQDVLAKTLNQAQARLAVSSIDQFAAAHMLSTIGPDYVEGIRCEYEARRDVLFDALEKIPEVVAQKPKGAFYTVVRLPVDDTDAFAAFLLSDFCCDGETVFVAPASGFYMTNSLGRNKIRLASVLERDALVKAAGLLEKGLKAYAAKR